ncbi:unnamed protein product [Penicillium salamii]|uniref:HNH nuclease domain-containing protein n=1 Tax=Penicillium salamii TaxID=1612424 RepID=A0A9W4N6J3_9EURO|nr:unnamed protein product [Penicillium salamii]CAG8200436.1 unnamed protein product [Penicillium salamii]CAG8214808.1 unnamed protein product [Penicillium salamii]CAG8231739.1 unnamed protein product [Penicillium salamii]CAG8254852.1 unnamed protein product [Penicillium salamii]
MNNPTSCPGSSDNNLPALENRKRHLNDSLKRARKRLKPQGPFDEEYWARAGEMGALGLEKTQVQQKISLQRYNGTETEWKDSDEAKALAQQTKAHEVSRKICEKRRNDISTRIRSECLRASFMKLFTTSKLGLGIMHTGSERRNPDDQSLFRTNMIREYDAKRPDNDDHLWCPVLGDWRDSMTVVTSHLFGYMHGQTTMDAIFGKRKHPELFSPRNGILVSVFIEQHLDSGKLVIVPDLENRPKIADLVNWLKSPITRDLPLRYRDLDNRRLTFKSDFRPAARYLYFHYIIQLLRYSWQSESQGGEEAIRIMKGEHGKPFWGTPGRYLPKNMLLALVEELGHEYKPILDGASIGRSNDSQLLLEAGVRQIKHTRPSLEDAGLVCRSSQPDEEDEEESSDDEYDSDDADGGS